MLLLCCGDNTNAADLRLKTQGFALKTQLGEGFSRKPFRVKTNAGCLFEKDFLVKHNRRSCQ